MKVTRWQRLKWTIPVILFLTSIIDAALPAVFPKAFLGGDQIIISHITLYYILAFAIFFRESNVLACSFFFGLFYDLYNTTILGLYGALYFIITYIVLKAKKYFPKNWLIQYLFFVIAICVLDFVVYLFYLEFAQTGVSVLDFLVNRLTPTLIFNTVVAIILNWPTKALFRWLGYEEYIIF